MADQAFPLEPPPQLTRPAFAKVIRQKYVTEHGEGKYDPYGDLSDDDLVDAYTQKYPVYQTWITKAPTLPGPPPPARPGPIPSPEYLGTSAPPSRRVASARTGGVATTPAIGQSIFDRPLEGAVQAGTGAVHVVTGQGGRRNAAADVLEGAMQAGEPLLLTGLGSAAAAKTLATGLVAGTAGSEFTRKVLEYAGASPETTRLTADVAGIVTGVGAAEGGRIRSALQERPRPIPGVLEGPPTREGIRPTPSDIVGEPTWRETQRMVESDQFSRGFKGAAAGEAAAQTTVSMQQAAELKAFQARIAAGMSPLEAISLQHQGITQAPPALKAAKLLDAAPPGARASFIAYPPDAPPPNPNLREVTRPELAGARGTQRIIAEGPPPPLEDVLASQLEDSLAQPPRQDIGLVKQPFNLTKQAEPPTLAQTQLRLKARPNRLRGRVQGIGAESIAQSPGGAQIAPRQSRLADLAEHRPAPPEAAKDPQFQQASQAARAEGFQGSDAELWRRYQEEHDKANFLNEQNAEFHPTVRARTLLQTVARLGGIGVDPADPGHAGRLLEARDMTRAPKPGEFAKGKTFRKALPAHPHAGTIAGVANVLRMGSADTGPHAFRMRGRTLEHMGDALAEIPEFAQEFAGKADWQVADAIDAAARTIREVGDPEPISPNLGPGWWQRQEHQDVASELADWFTEQGDRLTQQDLEGAYQEYLKLLGPGGDGGPPITGESQPVLPGAEGVRTQEVPTPEMEAPFSLNAPPTKEQAVQPGLFGEPVPPPSKPAAPKVRSPQPSLFERLQGEEGVLILDVPPGDPIGLKRWLDRHEGSHGEDPWYHRVAQALEDGNADRAWRLAAAASARDIAAVGAGQMSAEQRRALKGTQFAQLTGRTGQVGPQGGVARGDSGTTVVEPPPVKPGQRGKGITAGPTTGGILRPPPVRKPLQAGEGGSLAVLATDMTLGSTYQKSLLAKTAPELVTLIEDNHDTAFRLFRQVADQSIQGLNTAEAKRYLKLSDAEIASHYTRAITQSAKNLAALSSWRRQNEQAIQFLRPTRSGELKFAGPGGQFMSKPPDWMNEPINIGRHREIVPGVTPDDRTLEALSLEGASLEKLQAIWAISKPDPQRVGKFEAVENLSRAFLVSKPVTAIRNLWTQVGRYGVGTLDDALAGVFQLTAGDTQGAKAAFQMVGQRIKSLHRPGVIAKRPWAESMQAVYDYTAEQLDTLPGTDARKLLGLLETFPRQAADFMGYAAGELEPGGTQGGKTTGSQFLDDVALDPKVRNYLTVFNRAQEHTLRATTFDAVMRGQLQAAGYDPEVLLSAPTAEILKTVPQEQLDSMIGQAVYRALDETFASVPLTDSIPGRLLQTFSRHPLLLRFNYPFPRFNLLAAPRFIYDHSPAALLDLFAFPFERGRLFRGVQAEGIRTEHLPEIQTKLAGKELELGQAVRGVLETKREARVRQRLVERAQKQATTREIPGMGDPVGEARAAYEEALQAVQAAQDHLVDTKSALKDLHAQEETLQKKVREAGQIGAPTLPEYWARQATGTLGLFGAALALRSSDGAKDTEWYEYRWDRGNGESSLIDLRSFAPFVQYLFPADVIQDLYKHTDWDAVRAELPEGLGALTPTNYLPLYRSVWDNYSGKYTPEKLSTEFAQAFFSMSRAAGTTLTIVDLMTQRGWPGPSEITEALIGSIGQFLARFTVPLSTAKEAVAEFDPEEAKVRIAPPVSAQQPYGPLAAPLANVPYLSRLIPETVSQTTGEPLKSVNPFGRELSGVTERFRSDVEAEFKRIGMPSQAIYIPKTNDQGLDTQLAQTYAHYLQTYLPGILQGDPTYRSLPTPADQREFLGRILAGLRRAAVGEVRATLGPIGVKEAQEGATARAKRLRREKLLKTVEAGGPIVIEGEPQEEPEPAGPPGPPAGAGGPPGR